MAAARKTTKQDAAAKAPKPPTHVAKAPPAQEITPAMNDELFEVILDRIANGSSLLRLEKEDGFPARSTMWKWISATEDRRAAYEAARQDRADYRFELIDGIIAKVNAGTMEPNAGRVMIDAIRWQASKEKPAAYGDFSRVDLNVSRSASEDNPDELRARIIRTVGALPLLEDNNAD